MSGDIYDGCGVRLCGRVQGHVLRTDSSQTDQELDTVEMLITHMAIMHIFENA